MRYINLTKSKQAKVDSEDFEFLNQWKWQYVESLTSPLGTARRTRRLKNGKRVAVFMHRLITKAPKGSDVDHADHDSLNNQKANLRICSRSQNAMNGVKRKWKNVSSPYKGVSWHKRIKKWSVNIVIRGKQKHLGYFKDPRVAAFVYNQYAKIWYGDFAKLNEI